MKKLSAIIRPVYEVGMRMGGVFLIGMMLLVVANVIYRASGHVIAGSYELSQLLVVVPVGFALSYAALHHTHVTVKIFLSKFSKKWQSILVVIMSIVSFIIWALVIWGSINVLSKNWLSEQTEMLEIPFLPFRFIWVAGLILVCIAYLMDILNVLSEINRK